MPPILLPMPRSLSPLPGDAIAIDAPCIEKIESFTPHPQAYELRIVDSQILIRATDAAGLFYAHQTLTQLRRQSDDHLAPMLIADWPDFPVRGVMLDISRNKVPTMQTLRMLIDFFAELKFNQLQLYTEHTFAYRNHETVWKDASPITPGEVRELDAYCRERHIELVPNQNSFGHLERWLKYPQYEHLAEKPDGFTFPWGTKMESGFSLNPLDPKSLELLAELYDELLPNFSSRLFNVGCDETFDVGLGKSVSAVQERGKERVYLEFLSKINSLVQERDHRMMFWGDIILHRPDLLNELPRDAIALNWGYEASHPFEQETAALRDAGIPYYACPGTSSWCSFVGRTDNAIANLRSAALHGLRNNASGYLVTDWGDWGHLQPLPISYLAFAAGSAAAWCATTNSSDDNLINALNLHVFQDTQSIMGRLVYDLGNIYQAERTPLKNGSRLFWTLIGGADRRDFYRHVSIEEFQNAIDLATQIITRLDATAMKINDGDLVKKEIHHAASLVIQAGHHGLFLAGKSTRTLQKQSDAMNDLIAEHEYIWLARNRIGGLRESTQYLKVAQGSYRL